MVGNRCSTLFWHESWVDGMVLKECFSILFSLVIDKNVIVKDMVKNSVLDIGGVEVEVEKSLFEWGVELVVRGV